MPGNTMKDNRMEPEITEVLINGRAYSLSGADSAYIQKVAAFLNRKLAEVRSVQGYNHMSEEYRNLLLNLNVCDEYFRALSDMEELRASIDEKDRDLYSVKHDIVGTKLKLEAALKQQEVLEQRCEEWRQKYESLKDGRDPHDEDDRDGIIELNHKVK